MSKHSITNVGILGLSLLLGAGALVSHANQNDPPVNGANGAAGSGTVAMVDMDKLYTGSSSAQSLARRQAEAEAEMLGDLNKISTVPYLKREELSEYIGLLTKDKPDDKEQARLTELRQLSDTRQGELKSLSEKKEADLTPADKARISELSAQGRLMEKILPNVQEALRADQAQKLDAFRRDQMTALRAEVGKVAKERGIGQVFDSSALVYSVNDLTPMVLQRLNKHSGK